MTDTWSEMKELSSAPLGERVLILWGEDYEIAMQDTESRWFAVDDMRIPINEIVGWWPLPPRLISNPSTQDQTC